MTSDSSTSGAFVQPAAPQTQSMSAPRANGRSVGGLFIAAIVAGFIVFWPVGLALLGWALWRDQIMQWKVVRRFVEGGMPSISKGVGGLSMSGLMARKPANSALAEYLASEQDRLRSEQQKLDELVKAFEAFKSAEQQSRDQEDFEIFLRQRQAPDEQANGNGAAR